MKRKRSAAEAGFTLIEVLVVLGILGFLSLLMFTALRIGTSVWTATEHRSESRTDIGVVQSLLRRLIEQAYPALVRHADGSVAIAFRGTAGSIELSTPLPMGAALGGFQRVQLYAADRRLVVFWQPERNKPDFAVVSPDRTGSALLAGITAFRLAYFGQAEGASAPAWHNEWIEQKALPRLVSVDIAFADSRQAWPRMTVAPAIDVDATCIFDPLTRGCRGR